MVSAATIQAKINYGLSKVGEKTGSAYAWYRPGTVAGAVVQAGNLLGSINALVTPTPALVPGPVAAGKPDVYGGFDPTLFETGDYLVGQGFTYFIGSYLPLAGVSHLFTCNEVLTITRGTPAATGPGNRSGAGAGNTVLATGFPGWIKSGDRRQPSFLHLPGEVQMGTVNILLPTSLGFQLERDDRILTNDETPQKYQVQSADLSPNGWAIIAVNVGAAVASDFTAS